MLWEFELAQQVFRGWRGISRHQRIRPVKSISRMDRLFAAESRQQAAHFARLEVQGWCLNWHCPGGTLACGNGSLVHLTEARGNRRMIEFSHVVRPRCAPLDFRPSTLDHGLRHNFGGVPAALG